VPFAEESITHPSSALGVKSLSIFVREFRLTALAKAYSAILGMPKMAAEDLQPPIIFEMKGLNDAEGGRKAMLSLQISSERSQLEAMEKRGGLMLGDLILGVPAAQGGTNVPRRIDVGDGGIGGLSLDFY
jgi:hypothetical protein